LAYTAETRGNLLPCTCPGNPLGGLARRVGFLDSLRAGSTQPLVVVDAGSFFPNRADYPLLPESEVPRLLALHTEAAVAAGYDAIALGPPPSSPPDGARWLGANEARLVTKEGLRLAIAVIDEHSDPAPAAAAVRSLGRTDLVIVLCSGDLSFGSSAAATVGAQVVVVSRGACLKEPLWIGDVLFLGPGQAGKYVGVAELSLPSAGAGPVRALSVRLRSMDGSAPTDTAWQERVEETTLSIERAHPQSLSQGE